MKNNTISKSTPSKRFIITEKTKLGPIRIEFELDSHVWFIPDGTHIITTGTVVHIRANIGYLNEKQYVTYTIEYANNGNTERIDVSYEDVAASKEQLLEKKGLEEFHCEVYLDRCSSIRDKAIATDWDKAEEVLKMKYPQAYSINRVDPEDLEYWE